MSERLFGAGEALCAYTAKEVLLEVELDIVAVLLDRTEDLCDPVKYVFYYRCHVSNAYFQTFRGHLQAMSAFKATTLPGEALTSGPQWSPVQKALSARANAD